jgi:hypothetical protein
MLFTYLCRKYVFYKIEIEDLIFGMYHAHARLL